VIVSPYVCSIAGLEAGYASETNRREQASACAPVHIFDQRVCLYCRAFARDNTHHEAMRGGKGDVIPVVPLFAVRRIARIAVLLLFPPQGPLRVARHLTRLRGKRDQHIMPVVGLCACQQTLPAHRIPLDPYQTPRLADATALRDVVQP